MSEEYPRFGLSCQLPACLSVFFDADRLQSDAVLNG